MGSSSWLQRQTSHRGPRRRSQHRPATARFRPWMEALDHRWLPSQIGLTVSSLADSGPGTLRAAITAADGGSARSYVIGLSLIHI